MCVRLCVRIYIKLTFTFIPDPDDCEGGPVIIIFIIHN